MVVVLHIMFKMFIWYLLCTIFDLNEDASTDLHGNNPLLLLSVALYLECVWMVHYSSPKIVARRSAIFWFYVFASLSVSIFFDLCLNIVGRALV